MKRKAIIALVVIIALTLALLLRGRRPMLYEGKTARQWVLMLDPDVNHKAEHDQAAAAIQHIGIAALPDIESLLRRRSESPVEHIRAWAARYLHIQTESLSLPNQQLRASRAAYTLAELAKVDISSLIPDLIFHTTNSGYLDSESGRALARSGPRGIEALTNMLVHGDARVRDRAAYSLGLERKNPIAAEALVRAVNSNSDHNVQVNSLLYLARSSAPTNVVVSLALKFLQHDPPYDREIAVWVLRNYASDPSAREALENATHDPDPKVRAAAEDGLKKR